MKKLLLPLLAACFLVGCPSGPSGPDGGDWENPSVPAGPNLVGAEAGDAGTEIDLTFSRDLDPASLSITAISLNNTKATLSNGSIDGSTLRLTLTRPLTRAESPTINLGRSAVKATDGGIFSGINNYRVVNGSTVWPDPAIAGFDLPIQNGSYWTYEWETSTRANFGNTTVSNGSFTVRLGDPVSFGGIDGFALSVSGSLPDSMTLPWTALAISHSRVMGSIDGSTWIDIFNAMSGANAGGGFLYRYSSSTTTVICEASVQMNGNATDAYCLAETVGHQPGTYYPGYGTVYTGDYLESSHKEFFVPGLGPCLYQWNYSNVGGSSSLQKSVQIGLTRQEFAPVPRPPREPLY